VRPLVAAAAALFAVVLVLACDTVSQAGAARRDGAGASAIHVETVRLREWRATLTARLEVRESFSTLKGIHLRVTLRGEPVLGREVRLPSACRDGGCTVIDDTIRMLELHDLGGGRPSAVLWLFTGGAHCCSVAQVVPFGTGKAAVKNFGNPGASIGRIGGVPVFASQDDRFSYLYTSYAASVRPLQLWRLHEGRFSDVTASYRGRVAADARGLEAELAKLLRRKEEVRGMFSAWAADTCRLGGRVRVEARLRELMAAGAFSPPRTEDLGPTGARYAAALLRDLTRWGYCR
jgi:hypothetical protein